MGLHLGSYHLCKGTCPFSLKDWAEDVSRNGLVAFVSLVGVEIGGKSVKHCVLVDVVPKRVYDSAERYALELRPGVIQLCVGDVFSVDCVQEVGILVVHQQGRSQRKSRRNPYGKKKRMEKRLSREEFKRVDTEMKRKRRTVI